jgi:hypothetical protein
VFYKSSDCPACPECEAARRPTQGFMAALAAPARRALEGAGLDTLGKLARRRESEVRELHGMGPNALARLRAYLAKEGLAFKPERGNMKGSNKTKPTRVSVAEFLRKKAAGKQLADSQELVKLFREITGEPPKMWGPSIVGFGKYHYVYDSGREGDAPLLGFSPRKPEMVLYLMAGRESEVLRKKLGRHKASVSCIYIKSLDDIDREVLRQMARASIAETRSRYPD